MAAQQPLLSVQHFKPLSQQGSLALQQFSALPLTLICFESAFTEQQAAGRTFHLPLRKDVDVLLTREGVRTCRWYFDGNSALPVGVDIEYAQGVDEARLLFADWADRNGAVFPGRIGLISGAREEQRWLDIGSVTVNRQKVSESEEKKP